MRMRPVCGDLERRLFLRRRLVDAQARSSTPKSRSFMVPKASRRCLRMILSSPFWLRLRGARFSSQWSPKVFLGGGALRMPGRTSSAST